MASLQPINNRKEYEKVYSKELKDFLNNLNSIGKDFPINEITPLFFTLIALESKNTLLYRTLNTFLDSLAIEGLHDSLLSSVDPSLSGIHHKREIPLSSDMVGFIKKSINEAKLLNHTLITTNHILLAILSEENNISKNFGDNEVSYSLYMSLVNDMYETTNEIEQTESIDKITLGLPNIITMNVDDISDGLNFVGEIQKQLGLMTNGSKNKENKGDVDFCTNLNKMAENGHISRVMGRDEEISKIIQILNRHKSNNVVIVGDPGVGKTTLVEGLVQRIVSEEVPPSFLDKKIWKLNIGSMVAGTQFRGMFEERMETLISKLKKGNNNVLFIDDIQTAVHNNNKNSDVDIMGMLNGILNDGSVQVIVSTNHKGYRNIFEGDNNYASKFQKLILQKPSREECFNIIKYIIGEYEKHHSVKYSDRVINLSIDLAERYISERTVPTSAIDIIDEVGSYCYLKNIFTTDIAELKSLKKEINNEIKKELKKDNIERVNELEKEIDEIDSKTAKFGSNTWAIIEKGVEITVDDVYHVVSKKTGVPISKLNSVEKRGLKDIESILKKKVIGQDEAIDTICKVIKRNKLGLSSKNKPIGSYLLVGQSGVGKTYLAKKIAEEVFGDEKYLIRFDMSEYADKTSVNKLIGSSAGYVGYDEGGLLTEAIKKNKYAVLLIDEIEKANDEVFNIFLQVLDEGFLTDNSGFKVDFKNTIIIMTSNVGTKRASTEKGLGFVSNENEKYKDILDKELKNKFPPEFINRLDEVVYFNTLNDDNLRQIIKIEMDNLKVRLESNSYKVEYLDNVVDYLMKIVEKEKEYGARPILRTIQKEVENKIIDIILNNEEKTSFFISSQENVLVIS